MTAWRAPRRQRDPYWSAQLEAALPGVRVNCIDVKEIRWANGEHEIYASVSITAPAERLVELGVLDADDLTAATPCGAWRRRGADLHRSSRGIRVDCRLMHDLGVARPIAGVIIAALLGQVWRPPTRKATA